MSKAIIFVLALSACSGTSCSGKQHTPVQVARISIEGAAHGLAATDAVIAQAITHDSQTPHAPGSVDHKWRPVVMTMEATRTGLLLAERTVDTYTTAHGSACPAYLALSAVSSSIHDLESLLTSVGVSVPTELNTTLSTLVQAGTALAPQCPDGGV